MAIPSFWAFFFIWAFSLLSRRPTLTTSAAMQMVTTTSATTMSSLPSQKSVMWRLCRSLDYFFLASIPAKSRYRLSEKQLVLAPTCPDRLQRNRTKFKRAVLSQLGPSTVILSLSTLSHSHSLSHSLTLSSCPSLNFFQVPAVPKQWDSCHPSLLFLEQELISIISEISTPAMPE